MPRLITRYIFKEIAVPLLLSLAILTLTALLSKVIKLVDLMLTHGMGPSFIFWFIASVIPSFLIYTIPISFLIAVLVAFTRLSSDNEITAMKASGVSLFTMMRPVAAMAVVVFSVTMCFTLYVFPWGNMNLKRLLFDAARTKLISGIEEKTFYNRFKGIVLYVDHMSKRGRQGDPGKGSDSAGVMEGVFISNSSDGKEPVVFFAKEGVFEPSPDESGILLRLTNGTMQRKSEKDETYHMADFSSYLLELKLPGAAPALAAYNRSNRELYPAELSARVREITARGEDPGPYIIDLHKRFALPASVVVFSLLGLPLGIQKVRTARFTGFSISLGVVLAYYVASTALEALGNNGVLNPVLSVWGSDLIFGCAGLFIFYNASKDKPLISLG